MDLPTPRKPVVLVAEDDPQLRALIRSSLDRNNFEVLLAADGHKALQVYREHKKHIDLVVMDVQMPGLNGRSALQGMQIMKPDVLCCFISGSIDAQTEMDLLDDGAAFILQKPFGPDQLPPILRHLLDRAEIHQRASR
jgi:two-component system cell cycle sensor histidine kinase/response regulator CckA